MLTVEVKNYNEPPHHIINVYSVSSFLLLPAPGSHPPSTPPGPFPGMLNLLKML